MNKQPGAVSDLGEQVRRLDPDRFLTALFAPPKRREALFAVYALNAELARIREAVQEPMLGLMRVQWWRDVVERLYEGGAAPAGHPVAGPLADAVAAHAPPKALFDTLLDARDLDMDAEPITDRAALSAYAEATGGVVARLALWMLGGTDDAALAAAGAVGRAWALTGLVRAVPFHLRQGRLYLPGAALSDASRQALHTGRADADARALLADLCAEAAAALTEARRLHPRPGRARVAALLPAVLADGYLARLRAAGHDPFAARVALPRRRPVMLLLNAWRGRY